MDMNKDNIKSGFSLVGDTISEIASSVAEKNRLRVQLNHIRGLIKADTATRDQAYIELGRYYYEHLREGAAPENEAICAVVDAANQRISNASIKYMELLNLQNETKICAENTEKLKKYVAAAAADAAKAAKEKGTEIADKAKTAAAELKDKAAVAVEDVKGRFAAADKIDIDEAAAEEAPAEEAAAEEAPAGEAAPAEEKAEAPAEESPESFDF